MLKINVTDFDKNERKCYDISEKNIDAEVYKDFLYIKTNDEEILQNLRELFKEKEWYEHLINNTLYFCVKLDHSIMWSFRK